MDFFKNIWDFIVSHAMNIWALIATGLVAIFTFFSFNIPGWLDDYTTTAITSEITTEAPTKAPWTLSFTQAQLAALGCTLYEDVEIKTYNSYGSYKPYTIKGYRLKDVLLAAGADMSAINSASILVAADTDSSRPASAEIGHALLISDESYIAVEVLENGESAGGTPRLFPAANHTVEGVEGLFVNNSLCCKEIDKLTLNYN